MVGKKEIFEEKVKKSFLNVKKEISEIKEGIYFIKDNFEKVILNKNKPIKEINIKNKTISSNPEKPIFFIAEIGINHNGDLHLAKQMIDLAVINGADAVKFQKRTPEICVPGHQKNLKKETPWGEMTYFEYKKRIEFGEREYDEIDRYCREKNILWTASPWDTESINFLDKYDLSFYKIPSAKLTDKEYLLKIKEKGKPIFLSTGMSTEEEIKKAVEILDGSKLVVLHCNSEYPANEDELNLNYLQKLEEMFPEAIIGYSGHEGGIAASVVAGTIGARVIERHITLDRAMWGTDQASSLEFEGIRRLIRDLKKIPRWKGKKYKIVTEGEKKVKEKLRDKETIFN